MTSLDLTTICSQRRRQQILSYPINRLEISSPYANTSYTQMQLNMKRKVQILKYQTKDKNLFTKSDNWALLNKQTNSKTIFTNRMIEPLFHRDINTYINYITPPYIDYTTCPNSNTVVIQQSNKSDVPGPIIDLYDDPNVPLYMYNESRVFGIQESDAVVHMNYIYNSNYYIPDNILTDLYIHYVLANSKEVTTEQFDVSLPFSLYINATVKPYATSGIGNGSHINISESSNILISLKSVSFRIVYNNTTINTGDTVSFSHLTDKEYSFDISFTKMSDTDSITAIKYIGTIDISNINITTIPGFIYDMKVLVQYAYNLPSAFTDKFQDINIGSYFFPSETNKIIEQNVKFTDNNSIPSNVAPFTIQSNTDTTKGIFRILNESVSTTINVSPTVDFSFENIILSQYVKIVIDKYNRLLFRNTKPDSILSTANRLVTPLQYKAGRKYYITDGDYYFVGIPIDNPLTILNNGNNNILITSFNPLVARATFTTEYSNYTPITYETPNIQVSDSVNDGKYTFYTGGIKISVIGDFGSISFRSLNNGYLDAFDILNYYSSVPPSLTNNIHCLYQNQDNVVNIINKNTLPKYTFNSQTSYDDNGFIAICVGKYKLVNIPNEYAIGFDVSNNSAFQINTNYTPYYTIDNLNYYSGSIEFTVLADFGSIDYKSINNGYMGGRNKLIFNRTCPTSIISDSYVNVPSTFAIQCLKNHNIHQIPYNINDNIVSVEQFNGDRFIFNDISFSLYEKIGLQVGAYRFTVPSDHAIGFDVSSTAIDISGSSLVGAPTNTSVNQTSNLLNNIQHYNGEVYIIISGPFNNFSYHCYNHGYMGGYLRFTYSSSCVSGSNTIVTEYT